MTRRFVLGLALFLSLLAATPHAWAGSYLDRAALLLDESRKEGDLLQPRMNDKELVALIKVLAEARASAGQKMEVPAAIGKAHPHLLLVLTHHEQALEAASRGDFKKFMEHLLGARDEDRTFRALIAQLGYTLPELRTKP